jgi:hypothetical protein
MTAVIVLALALQNAGTQSLGQQTPQEPATLRGRITTTDGRPLTNAHLRLTRTDNPQRPRNTDVDDDGGFELENLAPGTYTLIASRSGFSNSNTLTVTLAPGETKEHVDLALRRLSAIVGRLADDNGDPVEGAAVTVMRLRPGGGRRIGNALSRRTNELGRFRVYNLQPGDYLVSASLGSLSGPASAMIPGYATTFFPGTVSPKDAQIVHVNAAEDVPGIDFSLIAVRTASIFGQMIAADGTSFQGGIQLAPSRRNGAMGGASVGAITYHDGRFEFPNVAPGDYVIDSTHNNEHGFAWVSVSGADVPGVIVQTQPGSMVTGRVIFEGTSNPPGRVSLVAYPADPDVGIGGQPNAVMRSDGAFQVGPLYGARRFRAAASGGWALKSIVVNGQDVTDTPLTFGSPSQSLKDVEVTFTDQITTLTGRLRTTTTKAATVLVFSDDRDRWYENSRYTQARSTLVDGSFTVAGMPPGGYFVAVLDALPEGATPSDVTADSDLLDRLSREASHVSLTERATATVTLSLISIQ